MGDEGICEVCKEPVADSYHNNTLNHKFHFLKWRYAEYRTALIKDRHGITLQAEAQKINNFNFESYYIKGKYKTKVTPEQLQLHNNTITFKCVIKNTRKDPIYIISVYLLHPYEYFCLTQPHTFEESENTYLRLLPGASYKFNVIFNTDVLTCASYKIPLSCDFQTIDNKESFSIVRTFLSIVDDQIIQHGVKVKSPFTNLVWDDVQEYKPTTKEVKYIDEYPIPKIYKRIITYGLERFPGITSEEEGYLHEFRLILQQLTVENYAKFWHILLWLEERAQTLMLRKYNMEKVIIQVQGKCLSIEVPGLAEKRPSVIVGDFILIRISGDHTAYKGFVGNITDKTVEISHVQEELFAYLKEYPGTEMDISFMLGRLSFERMHSGVDRIVATGMVKKLFPPNRVEVRECLTYELHDSQLFNESIAQNPKQKKAVKQILNVGHCQPYIVFGPPGTGKTVTIVEAILQLKKRAKKILVCAPSNAACDMLAEKLIPHCTKDELLRIHSATRERSTITDKLKQYSNMEDDEFTLVDIGKLHSYRIVVATLTLIGRFRNKYQPECVFIDEAAQASEPETDIAIAMINVGKQVVLAGDPKQLGPSTTKIPAKFGLNISLLERLMTYNIYRLNERSQSYDENFITMLQLNFRSHPDILLIPNELFYNNLLKAVSSIPLRDPVATKIICPSAKKKSQRKGRALEFYSVSAKEEKEGASPSFFNLCEANMVVKYVKALMNLQLPEAYKVRVDQIGVVTPYKRQVFKIKLKLKCCGFGGVEVGTTESFQGREKRIIIISTVRAQHSLLLHDRKYNLGFVKNDQRFNVAVTRAISKLIVIGNPLVLRTDSKWKQYMDTCEEFNTYFGNKLEKDDQIFRQEVVHRTKNFKHKDDQYHQ